MDHAEDSGGGADGAVAAQDGGQPDAAGLLLDWITIWQSEFAAAVLDTEQQGTLLRLVDGWAAQARAAVALMPAGGALEPSAGPAGADAAARAAAVAAAPDGRDAVIGRLLDRVAELERLVAGRPAA